MTFYTVLNQIRMDYKKQADLIVIFIKKFDTYRSLIHHVLCDFNEKDDDLRYLKFVKYVIAKEFWIKWKL
jgi:hypothetical protein